MFIPIGHDQDSVRRLPWVTFTIMGICVAVYLLTFTSIRSNERKTSLKAKAVAEYYFQHPETKLPKELENAFLGQITEYQDQRATFQEFLKETAKHQNTGRESLEEQQKKIDALVQDFYTTRNQSLYFVLGLVPAHQKIYAYITYQFMHGGFWHLFGNMLFLYLTGPYIEDVWGRPLFVAFYLSAGVISALIYCLKYPEMTGPLIGASGAIAGVMGAFLVRHARVKINFLFFFFMRPRIVKLPAWVMLPLWLAREILFGQAHDYGGGHGGGVAHWAHVAGFFYGSVVALAVRHFDVERKFVTPKLDAASTVHQNPVLDEAMEEMWHGDRGRARQMLTEYLQDCPGDIDAAAALWDISRDLGGLAEAAPFLMGAIREALRKKDTSFIETRWPEVMDEMEPEWLDPGVAGRVAELISKSAPASLVERTVDAIHTQVDAHTAPGLLVRLARSGAQVRATSTATYARLALENPEVPEDTRTEMQEILKSCPEENSKPPETVSPPTTVAPQVPEDPFEAPTKPRPEPIDHQLEILEATPLSWDSSGRLQIEVRGQKRAVNTQQVIVIAVGGISAPGSKPFLVIDLMLDAPWSNRRKLRDIRLRSSDFDPRKLVEAPTAMRAFQVFLEELFKTSEATPFPDPDAARGRPFKQFESMEAFEAMILNS